MCEVFNCNKCKKCGLIDLKRFLKESLADFYKVEQEKNVLMGIKFSIDSRRNLNKINRICYSTLQDMYLSTIKFPLSAFNSVETSSHIIYNTYFRLSYWLRHMVVSDIICPQVKDIVENAFATCIEYTSTTLSDILGDKNIEDFTQKIITPYVEIEPVNAVEQYFLINEMIFLHILKILDVFHYTSLSWAIVKDKKMIFVSKEINGMLSTYIKEMKKRFPYIKYIRVIDRNIQPEVEKVLMEEGFKEIKIV